METPMPTQWCLVGNIVETRFAGVGGAEEKNGTPHFSGKTKVYCLPAQWGDGYEQIVVIGRHRRSRRFVKMVISSSWVTNWRAQVVYSPVVLNLLHEEFPRIWETREEVEAYVQSLNQPSA
ncbi:MAG: hypothetical protein LBV49_09790 [Azonexus sp.]|jgi:hypothetical protein|nr:hypothetical protein [Azonexus sp.]